LPRLVLWLPPLFQQLLVCYGWVLPLKGRN